MKTRLEAVVECLPDVNSLPHIPKSNNKCIFCGIKLQKPKNITKACTNCKIYRDSLGFNEGCDENLWFRNEKRICDLRIITPCKEKDIFYLRCFKCRKVGHIYCYEKNY